MQSPEFDSGENAARSDSTVTLVGNASWYIWKFRRGTIRALLDDGYEVSVIAPEDETSAELAAMAGVTHVPWRLDWNGKNPFAEARSFAALFRHLARSRPQYVFSFTLKPNVYAGLACRALRIPHATNVTGLGTALPKSSLGASFVRALFRASQRSARRIFTQNPDDAAFLLEKRLAIPGQLSAIPGSGVDLDAHGFHPMPPSPPTFVFIARMQTDKGARDFVAAARAMRSEKPDARFVLVGSNKRANDSAITSLEIDQWAAEGVVEVAGEQSDVRPFLRRAHALVLPSHGGEGMPRVVLEAASTGRPAIVSDVPGCRHAVDHGRTGLIHRRCDQAALIDALRAFIVMSDDARAEMGAAARRRAEREFSESQVIEAYLDCLSGL